jgi:hypothetical protein
LGVRKELKDWVNFLRVSWVDLGLLPFNEVLLVFAFDRVVGNGAAFSVGWQFMRFVGCYVEIGSHTLCGPRFCRRF